MSSEENLAVFPPSAPAGLPTAAPRRPAHPLNPVLPIVAAVGSVLYVLICLGEVYALSHRASLANQLANGTADVTIAQAQSADRLVSDVAFTAIGCYLVLLLIYVVWTRSVRTVLASTGRVPEMLKQSGYVVFRVVWLVSLLLGVFLNSNATLSTPQQVVSHDHEYMAYFALRAVLGVVLAVFVLRLKSVSERVYREALAQPLPFAG